MDSASLDEESTVKTPDAAHAACVEGYMSEVDAAELKIGQLPELPSSRLVLKVKEHLTRKSGPSRFGTDSKSSEVARGLALLIVSPEQAHVRD